MTGLICFLLLSPTESQPASKQHIPTQSKCNRSQTDWWRFAINLSQILVLQTCSHPLLSYSISNLWGAAWTVNEKVNVNFCMWAQQQVSIRWQQAAFTSLSQLVTVLTQTDCVSLPTWFYSITNTQQNDRQTHSYCCSVAIVMHQNVLWCKVILGPLQSKKRLLVCRLLFTFPSTCLRKTS